MSTADREVVTTRLVDAPRARVRGVVTMRMLFETADEHDKAVKVFGIVEGGKQTLARLEVHVATM